MLRKMRSLQASISHLGVEVAPQMPMEAGAASSVGSISYGPSIW